MLDTRSQNLSLECASAREYRDLRLTGVSDSIARYQGRDRGGNILDSDAPENVEFEFVSYMLPSLIFDRPIMSMDTPLLSKQEEVLALEVGTNRWVKDTRMREPLAVAAVDYCFAWAVLLTSSAPAPDLGESDLSGGRRGIPNRPYTKRVSFRTAFRDPLATNPYEYRFAGHDMVADKSDLIKRAEEAPESEGWNLEVIRRLATDSDLQRIGRKPVSGQPTRNEVVYTQVWVADAQPDWDDYPDWSESDRKRCHGMLFFFSDAMDTAGGGEIKSEWIRKPQPYYGPRWGPYVFIGEHIVPDDPTWMGPMQAVASSIRFYNDVNRTAIEQVRAYKRLILTNDPDGELPDLIRNGRMDNVYNVIGYERGQAEGFEIGGVTNQSAAHLAMLKDIVDRGLGMSDVQRGAATGAASATENALAAESASARIALAKKQWADGVSMAIKTAAWYLCHDEDVSFPIGMEEAMAIGQDPSQYVEIGDDGPRVIQPRYFGGTDDEDWFDTLELELQPWSMERMSEARAQSELVFLQNWVTVMGPLVPQMPWIQWQKLERAAVKRTGIQDLRGMFDLSVAAEMAQVEALYRQAQAQASDGPRLASDVAKSKGNASGPAPTGGVQASAPAKPKPKPLQGRTMGGTSGQASAQSAGAT